MHHTFTDNMGELCQCQDVKVQHLTQPFKVMREEVAIQTKSSIVDQDIQLNSEPMQAIHVTCPR